MQSPVFESLRVWHDARRLTNEVYLATRLHPFRADASLRNQLRRSVISVMSNIAEGKERGSHKEFARFLRISKGSAGEVRAQLYAAEDLGYLTSLAANELRQHATIVSRQIAALIQRATGEPESA